MVYLAFNVLLGTWLLIDARRRKVGGGTIVLYVIGAVVLSVLVVPFYVAYRPLKAGETREGGAAWNVLKSFALLWSVGWALLTVRACLRVAPLAAESAGGALGFGLGLGMYGCMWFVPLVGALVLGLFLKKSTVETGPTGPLAGAD